jgi:putative membrane protein
MRRLLVALIGLCLATAPAFAQSIGESTGANDLLGIAPSTADFVKEAAMSDMFEIQSSQLAQQKADPSTQSFAKEMVADHTKTSNDLKSLVAANGIKITVPAQLDSSHQDMLDTLNQLSGADFTRKYHDDQLSTHKNAVSLFRRYAKGGGNAALKAWAAQTLPALQQHLQMARDLDR